MRVSFFPPSFQSPRRSPADPRPDATQTLPLSSFSPAQLRKGNSACDPCCSSRAARGADHDATATRKSAKEVRAERKEKRKREEEEAKRKKQKNASGEDGEPAAGSSDAAAMTHALAEVKSSAIDFGAVARFDPDAASSSDSESKQEGTGDDEKKGDDDDDASMKKNEEASSKETQTRLRETSTIDQKAAEAQLRKRQVYLGGVPFHKTEDEIRGAFEEENLPVEKIDCMTFPDSGRFRGIAILTFATREAAKGALAWNGEEWDGTFLTVKKYAPKERREEGADGGGGGGGGDDGVPRKESLLGEVKKTEGQRLAFVCNLSWDVTEETLRAALAGCEVADVRMGVDKETGHFRGFAHVELATDEDLERAVCLNGASVLGRPMKIAYATARKSGRNGDSATAGRGGRGGRVAKKE